MKFLYDYRTKDNIRYEGVISAASREAAFDALRAQGIKPAHLNEAPGIWNKISGRGKYWILISAAAGAAVFFAVLAGRGQRRAVEFDGDLERSQIYGDPAFLGECAAKGWSNVFTDEGVQFLAKFAQPGKKVTLSESEKSGTEYRAIVEDLKKGLGMDVKISGGDPDEVRKMKRIVNGMKHELAEYVARGGKVEGYVERLIERQNIEARIVEYTKNELMGMKQRGRDERARARGVAKWNEKNKFLRDMGLMPVPLPEEWEVQ